MSACRCISTLDGYTGQGKVRKSSKRTGPFSVMNSRPSSRRARMPVWTARHSGCCRRYASCAAILMFSQRSSQSRNAIHSPVARATPALRATDGPRFLPR
jgi:hypothetical protein